MTARQLAEQICRDVLTLRGPSGSTTFTMTTDVLTETRITLAKRFDRMVPKGATMGDVPQIAAGLAPLLTVGR